jgi:aminotransferase
MKTLAFDPIAPAVRGMPPSGIRRFFDLVSEMSDVISLGVGEPDFVTPWQIREAAIDSLHRGQTMYTSNRGLLELREAIAGDLGRRHNLVYDPKTEILITVGVSEALDLAMRALLTSGDEVIIPEPCYVSYKPCTILAGGKPVVIPTRAEDGFNPTAEQIEAAITSRSKILMLSYPNNPTGAILSAEELLPLTQIVQKHNLLVIADEIYDHLTYNGQHTSVAALPGMQERTILLNGFSKAYAMTGWRVGYAAAHSKIIGAMTRIHQYTMLCASIISQNAALEALKHGAPERDQMFEEYAQRRSLIVAGLRDAGLECFEPGGAFYAFPSIKSTGLSSEEFCEKLLKDERVAVVPGNAFGESGEGYIRCSYASSLEEIKEAIRRIGRFVEPYLQDEMIS